MITDHAGVEDEERGDPGADQGEAAVKSKEEESQAGGAEFGHQKGLRAPSEEEIHERVQFGASMSDVRQGEQGVEDMEHKDHDKDRGQTPAKPVDIDRLGVGPSARAAPPPTQERVAAQGRRGPPSAIAPEPLCGDSRLHHSY